MPAREAVPTNERIVWLLEAIRADLAESKKQQERIARSIERVLGKKAA